MIRHVIVVPIVLPLVTVGLLLLLGERRKRIRGAVNIASSFAGLIVAAVILRSVDASNMPNAVGVYLTANWEAPFGIVLVADRLSALMLMVVGAVSVGAALYAEARWSRTGVNFHALFQILLMGLNGAFLTGDLFNLFVFFEVLLAASYGLQLHGSGWPRVRSGLHYIAVNLLASVLFLVGLAILYGVMGTLSMADIAAKLAFVPPNDVGLLHIGTAVLAIAFLIKAAIWPLNSWLVPAYSAASPPVAALFALMTKVGVYALVRLWTLFYSSDVGLSLDVGAVLLYGGFATVVVGTLGVIASIHITRIAAFSLIVSSGILLSALGTGTPSVTSSALFYLLSATIAVSALFLLGELVERIRAEGRSTVPNADVQSSEDTNLDDEEAPLVGRAFPVSIALLGLAFFSCGLIVAGLPPLSGFVAKLSLLTSVIAGVQAPTAAAWWFFALLLFSGVIATISLSRAGIRYFWSRTDRVAVHINAVEVVSVLALIAYCVLLTVFAEPVLRYTTATAESLHSPKAYIESVMSAKPRPGPTRAAVDQ